MIFCLRCLSSLSARCDVTKSRRPIASSRTEIAHHQQTQSEGLEHDKQKVEGKNFLQSVMLLHSPAPTPPNKTTLKWPREVKVQSKQLIVLRFSALYWPLEAAPLQTPKLPTPVEAPQWLSSRSRASQPPSSDVDCLLSAVGGATAVPGV